MKRFIFSILTLAAISFGAGAQTAEEIISNMEKALEKQENNGLVMTMETKVPIMGTMSIKSYSLGDKMRMESKMMGVKVIAWSDGKTSWSYTPELNEIEITEDVETSEESGSEAEMFSGITEGYDVSIKEETDKAWHIHCSKSKSNKDKDVPKNMDLVVAKGTFYPISLSTKMSGITITMRDIEFGFDVKLLDFDLKDYPDAKIIDKRKEAKNK